MESYIKQGDCLELLKELPDNSIDLVVTDCPYKVISGGTKSKWKSGYPTSVLNKNDGKIFDHNDIELSDWLPEVYRVLKDNSDFYCMINVLNINELLTIAKATGFKLHNILVWEKNTANANRWYMKNGEFTCYFYKGEAKTINNPGSKQIHQFNNIIGTKVHPTEKPVELMELYVTNSSNEGDIVLDPFGGSGSTLVAAKKHNRRYIGFEIDEKYYNIMKERLEGVKQEEVFENGLFDYLE